MAAKEEDGPQQSQTPNSPQVPALLSSYAIAPDSKAVTFVGMLNGFQVSWTLGAQVRAKEGLRAYALL